MHLHPRPAALDPVLAGTPLAVTRYLETGGVGQQTGVLAGPKGREGLGTRTWECLCGASHDRDVNAAINIAMAGLVGVEERVTAARLLREAKAAKAQERKTKLAVNKAAKAAAAGHGRPVEGSLTA